MTAADSPASPDASPAPASTPPAPPPRRRWRWPTAGAAAVVLYAALGFLLAPRLVRQAIVEKGSAALKRPVAVAEVKINPFTLSVWVRGLEVKDRDGGRLAAWEELHVRLAPWKVLFRDVGLAELTLTRPFLRLGLDRQGRLNVQDLLEGDGAPQPAPAAAKKKEPALGLALDRLEVLEASVVFGDATVAPPFETTLGPLTVKLRDFRTRGGAESPYSFEGTTEAGETFSWSGTVLSSPIRSRGTVAFSKVALPKYDPYLRGEAPNLEVRRGTLALSTRYELEWGAASRRLAIQGLKLGVADLALAGRGDAAPSVELPSIEVSGVDVDVLGKSATVAEVKLSGGAIDARRAKDRSLNLARIGELTPSPPSKWTWRVGAVALEGLGVRFEDAVPATPGRLELSGVALRIEGLAKGSGAPCPFSASFKQGAAGTFAVKGTVRPFAPAGELSLDGAGLELAALAPWLDGEAPVRLADGKLGLSARTTFDASGAATAWTFGGDVRVEGLVLLHPTRNEELVRWRALEVLGVDAASAGRRAAVKTVRLVEPRLRAVIFEDGTTAFASAPKGGAEPAPAPAPAAKPAAPGPAWRTSLGLFQIVRGRFGFVDRSIAPPVLLSLTDVEAKVASLSSDPHVRSTVDVKALVEGGAPLTVTGTLNPLQTSAYTDLVIAGKGVDLSPLGPYAGKHLGYGLQKGKLDVDLKCTIQDKALASTNVARVDQLTLGEATNSPDATKIPVRLALALLKDKDGVILLDVPVEGKLDDPEFKLGRVIWRTVLNVLVKVATSPFSALAALAGGGEADLSLVEFAPGGAALDEGAHKRIELLAKSLAQRPALALEYEGTVDPGADGAALRRAELERLLRLAKGAAQRPPAAEDAVTISVDERPRWVAAAYEAAFPPGAAPKPAPGQPTAAPPTFAAMEEKLLGTVQVAPEALPALAAARPAAARDALDAAGVDPARLFKVEGGERASKEKGSRAYFSVQSR
ncbi:MAG TPA: DUF748 domain-containing protein [Anaeromyxobacteraceae bacterium]|nr:DUF748 domain-containing protein [Anaeromyxobacteraceae bacterium]